MDQEGKTFCDLCGMRNRVKIRSIYSTRKILYYLMDAYLWSFEKCAYFTPTFSHAKKTFFCTTFPVSGLRRKANSLGFIFIARACLYISLLLQNKPQ